MPDQKQNLGFQTEDFLKCIACSLSAEIQWDCSQPQFERSSSQSSINYINFRSSQIALDKKLRSFFCTSDLSPHRTALPIFLSLRNSRNRDNLKATVDISHGPWVQPRISQSSNVSLNC